MLSNQELFSWKNEENLAEQKTLIDRIEGSMQAKTARDRPRQEYIQQEVENSGQWNYAKIKNITCDKQR